jgi:glutamyl-tRNA synthetase
LGGALVALASWWLAKSTGGSTVLRVEDLDRPRVVPGAEERQLEDLTWLGLAWDEGPYRQTERTSLYDAALEELTAQGRTYPCDCSRAEIARVASAPHEGEDVVYPGTCRDKVPTRALRRPAATRLRIESTDAVTWTDVVRGPMDAALLHAGGDFVLRRGDGVYAYQLAVSADDLAMGITEIVRGDDLVPSTPRQLLLMQLWQRTGRLLWAKPRALPRYWHLPLVRAADGSRLAKRTPWSTLRELRALGVPPEAVVGHLAHALGLVPSPRSTTAVELAREVAPGAPFRREPWAIPLTWE